MRKVSILALLAIVLMLFASCDPAPRNVTTDDLEITAAFTELIAEAGRNTRIEETGDITTGTWGQELTGGTFEGTNGTLTSYKMTMSIDVETGTGTMSYEMAGTVLGAKHSVSVTATYPPETPDDAEVRIDGQRIIIESLDDVVLPG